MKKMLLGGIVCLLAAIPVFAQWSVDSMSSPHYNMITEKFNDRALFVSGGWEMYNFTTASWSNGSLYETRSAIKAAQAGTKAYFAGGWKGIFTDPVYVKTVDIYNASANTWSKTNLTQAREVGGVASLSNKVYFAGGRDAITMKKRVDIFNITSGARTTANLSKARTNIATGVNGNKIVFAGGWYFDFYFNHVYSNVVDIYDAGTGIWSKTTLSQKREAMSVGVAGNKILFAGGLTNTGNGISKNVDIYDVTTNTWTTQYLSVPRYDAVVSVVGHKVYFAGSGNGEGTVDVYDAVADSWSSLIMPYTLAGVSSAVINNQIFYAGGYDPATFAVSNVVQIYNTSTGQWSIQNLSQARSGIAVATLNNVTLFAGGTTKVTYPAVGTERVDIYTAPLRLGDEIPMEGGLTLQMSLYPNPASDILNVTVSSSAVLPLTMFIYDMDGRVVRSFVMNDYTMWVDLQTLAGANYFLTGYDSNYSKVTGKVIKKQGLF